MAAMERYRTNRDDIGVKNIELRFRLLVANEFDLAQQVLIVYFVNTAALGELALDEGFYLVEVNAQVEQRVGIEGLRVAGGLRVLGLRVQTTVDIADIQAF